MLASGRYEAGLQTWYAGIDPDNSTQLMCDQGARTASTGRATATPTMDAAQRDALSHYDRPTRKRAYARIEQMLARDAPYVYLWWPRQIEAVNTDLKNFRPNGIVESGTPTSGRSDVGAAAAEPT